MLPPAINKATFHLLVALVFLATAASTLFLAEFDANMLPYTYMGIAVFVTGIGVIYAKLQVRLSFATLRLERKGYFGN